jgi:hypothetical protein
MIQTGTWRGVHLLILCDPEETGETSWIVQATLQIVFVWRRIVMPVLLIPVLWVGGTAVVLGAATSCSTACM